MLLTPYLKQKEITCRLKRKNSVLFLGAQISQVLIWLVGFHSRNKSQPLVSILRLKSHISPLAVTWFLDRYDVYFWSTAKHCNADGLSQLLLPTPNSGEISIAVLINLMQLDALPVTRHQLRRCSEADCILSKVLQYTQHGWLKQLHPELKVFSSRQQELMVEAGCLLWGVRVIIPKKFRKLRK